MAKTVTVWLQTLRGAWEACGSGHAITVPPESVVLSADEWGPATASFDLRRNPGVPWPDLTAFTPVDIWVGGLPVWSGRIKETPTRDGHDRSISVHCEGWQNHLDDDLYERAYAHTNVGDWKDVRSFLAADLATYVATPQVAADHGVATLSWPKDQTCQNTRAAGIGLDLGPSQTAKRVIVEWESLNAGNYPGQHVALITYPTGVASGAGTNADDDAIPNGTSSGTLRATLAGNRYLVVQIYSVAGADGIPTSDVTVRIKAIRVFAETAYESSDQSALTASTVIGDALDEATTLLSTDRSSIDATTTTIPTYVTAGPQTARKAWADVNAFHDWIAKIDVDRRPVFKAKPTAALLEIGAWAGSEFEDASANSGEDIYDRTIVTGQTPAGDPIRASRTSAGTVVSDRGFNRAKELQASGPLPSDLVAADLLGDTWLAGKRTTPFRGTVTVTGGGVRETLTGATVQPERLLAQTGELLRFSDRIDPDTGAFGRDGRIVGVTYTVATDEAQIQIDSAPKSFEALLARLAVVTGAS